MVVGSFTPPDNDPRRDVIILVAVMVVSVPRQPFMGPVGPSAVATVPQGFLILKNPFHKIKKRNK